MSRRPTSMKPGGISRVPSSASNNMLPPRVPGRPPSAMSISGTFSAGNRDENDGRPVSPRKSSAVGRRTGHTVVNGAKRIEGLNENGEINIQVVVRCRGRSPQELAQTSPIITTTAGALTKSITVETTPLASSSLATFTTASSYGGSHAPSTKTYPFDKVFGPEADQTMVFGEVAEGMLDEVLAGYNCTIFAYGQTGTGKTYTMQGDLELSPLNAPKDSAGIVPRVLHRLFSLLEAAQNTEFSVKCSYVELYNEELRDLLSNDYSPLTAGQAQPMALGTGGNAGGLKLYEDGKKGTMIQGLEEIGVKSVKDALNLVNRGVQRRQVAETKMNTESSRSHTILSITVHLKETGVITGAEDLLKVGKFNLVDLAGSEAIGRSGATDKRAREAGMINQSLLTLGRVISALVEKGPHIPYRESKLTRLLQDSLGGKTKTCIVATVSPTRSNLEETLSTLDYAIRAKSIRNRPEVNQHLTKTGLLKEYLGDIERLKAEVLAAREKNGIYIPEDQWMEMQTDLAKQKSDYDEAKLRANACTVELATKKKEFDELIVKMLATTEELEQAREAERQLGALLVEVKNELDVSKVRLEEEMVVSEAYVKGEDRLDRVAEGLKSVATEGVRDVGGLFDKLARKTSVLGSNADASTRFGADLQGLSKELRHGLQKMHTAQNEMGRQLKVELSAHATKGQEISQRDMAALEASFEAFNQLSQSLAESIESGKVDAGETSKTLFCVKHKVQKSVRVWAQSVSDRSTRMVDELLDHQQEHLKTVGSVLESTADLVDAVITTAREHLQSEAQAAAKARQLTVETANAEISRLCAQNAMLAQLLANEKANTARLRTDLVSNLTNLVVNFTEAHDDSWSAAVAQMQSANAEGMNGIEAFGAAAEVDYEHSSARVAGFGGKLVMAQSSGVKQREAGQMMLEHVSGGMRSKLEAYGRETVAETSRRVQEVDGLCGRLEEGVAEASTRADARAKEESRLLGSMSNGVEGTHTASLARTSAMRDDIASLTSTLLKTHATTSKSFDKHQAATTTSLSSMVDRTAHFLESEIQSDVPTGVTPRKKAWNVQTTWERTEPRDVLIAAMRARRDGRGGDDGSVSPGSIHPGTGTGEESVPKSPGSTTSLAGEETQETSGVSTTLGSANSTHSVIAVQGPANGVAPSASLSTSQIRAPRSRLPSGAQIGKKMGGEDERPKVALAVLGEGGANIPRRTKRPA